MIMLFNKLKNQKDVLTSWVNRFLSLPIQFIIMPLTMSYLGIEDYALYLILTGLVNWFYLADFSSGLVLQNMIAQNNSENKPLNQIISYSFFLMILLIISWSIILIILSPFITKLLLKNYIVNDFISKNSYFILISILSLINVLITNTITKIYYSLGKGWQINLFSTGITILTFISNLLIYKYTTKHKLFFIIISNNLPNTIFILHYIYLKNKYNAVFNLNKFKIFVVNLIIRARYFCITGILSSIVLQMDYILISLYIDSKSVIQYNFVNKIFNISWTLFGAILISYYPILVKNSINKNWINIKSTIQKIIILGFTGYSIIFITIIIFKNIIAHYFFNDLVIIDMNLIILFMLYSYCRVWTDTFAFLASACELSKKLFIIVLCQSILSLSLQLFFINKFNITAILLGLIASYLLTVIWYIPYITYHYIKKGV